MFEYFKILILQGSFEIEEETVKNTDVDMVGLVAARKHQDKFTSLVDIMRAGSQVYFAFVFHLPGSTSPELKLLTTIFLYYYSFHASTTQVGLSRR